MSGQKLFLFRNKENIQDRDACKYVEGQELPESLFHCGHYFGCVILCGPNFSGGEFPPYDEVDTFLSEDDYNKLIDFNKSINELGYGIEKGDERYQKGIELCRGIEPIFDKLRSDEAATFKHKIMESEHEMMKEEYYLSDDDVDTILSNYNEGYEDKGIVDYVYENHTELGERWADEIYNIDEMTSRYFDYEQYGEDIAEGEEFVELSDGRIASLSY